MVIIGIDPSLSSTAMSIFKDGKLSLYNFTNNKPSYKWIKNTTHLIDYTFHKHTFGKDYSDTEVEKLTIYGEVTDSIINKIQSVVSPSDTVKIYIEGYSYSSKGNIIDLVVFSTLIRYKLLKIAKFELNVVSPSSLKKSIGSYVYEADKKGMYRNDLGKAAGSFDKKDMMVALLELKLPYEYNVFLNDNKKELLDTKSVSKPFDDINDSQLLCIMGCYENKIKMK